MLDMSGKLSIMNHNHFDPSLTLYMYFDRTLHIYIS